MPISPPSRNGELTLADIKARGVTPDDIDEAWLDDMVKRLFAELKRQLSQVENAGPAAETEQAPLRAANARTLASLERTLERLAKLEQQRALMRETKVAAKHDGARLALERRLDQLLAARRALGAPKEPDQR
jgi:hypothetical protein